MTLHETETDLLLGGGRGPEPQQPPVPGGISMRPAMIVVGLAALILMLFVTIGIVSSQSPTPVKHSGAAVGVPGVALRAVPAAGLLSPIVGERRTTQQHPQCRLRPGGIGSGSRTRTTLRGQGNTKSK